jgi:hypothetical protein
VPGRAHFHAVHSRIQKHDALAAARCDVAVGLDARINLNLVGPSTARWRPPVIFGEEFGNDLRLAQPRSSRATAC